MSDFLCTKEQLASEAGDLFGEIVETTSPEIVSDGMFCARRSGLLQADLSLRELLRNVQRGVFPGGHDLFLRGGVGFS